MTRCPSFTAVTLATLAAASLAGCTFSSLDLSSDKIDYKSAVPPPKSVGIEVPPDLTQLTRDTRYQQIQNGSVSAAALQSAAASGAGPSAPAAEAVATRSIGTTSVQRLGNDRWLHTTQTPEQLWPQLLAFWKERGFVMSTDDSATGVMETDWAENRGKLPLDFIRNSIGKVFDNAFSTGELDRFRTRIER
ncbi:MAG TPA: outer membrane protein assembly factor BamC, partial [Burkholderiaceae bacterium]